jgi:hypothetical protein
MLMVWPFVAPKECKDPCAGKLVNPVTHTICEECFYKAMDDISSAPAKTTKPNEKPKGELIMTRIATLENVINAVHQQSANHFDEIVPCRKWSSTA